MDFRYDFLVIGGGSGGVRAARIAAQYGARVAVVEKDRLGGTCVIRGCVPKKLFVYASHFKEYFEDAKGFGWSAAPSFDWPTLVANTAREVSRLEGLYTETLKKAGVDLYFSHGSFLDPHTLFLDKTKTSLSAANILIATGAAPDFSAAPKTLGDRLLVSDQMFELPVLPKRIAIVGGGYIALEFAGILNGLGVETTLLYRGEQILRGFDADLSMRLADEMRQRGVSLRYKTEISGADIAGKTASLHLTTGETLETDAVLWAAGRVPNTSTLGLDTLGVARDVRGAILVTPRYQTLAYPHIYAIGDVVNRAALTPLAIAQGQALSETLFGEKPWHDPAQDHPPTAVFSQPECATVGLSEQEAQRQEKSIRIYQTTFRPLFHTLSTRQTKVFMKLIVEQGSEKILGAHLLGDGSAEMIQLLAVIVKAGLTKHDLDRTLAVHPTAAEELVTLKG